MSREFEKNGWLYLKNIFTRSEIATIRRGAYKNNINLYQPEYDKTRGNVIMFYSPKYAVFAVKKAKIIIEELIGEEIIPTYWFMTAYPNKSYLKCHIDRPSCEISLSITIDSPTKWPLQILDSNNKKQKINIDIGSALLYKGIDLPHWRSPLNCGKNENHVQLFLHYVRKNGKYKEYAYDKDIDCFNLLNQD